MVDVARRVISSGMSQYLNWNRLEIRIWMEMKLEMWLQITRVMKVWLMVRVRF